MPEANAPRIVRFSRIAYQFQLVAVSLTAIPLDPLIATIVILYILKIGLNVYCKYTDAGDGGTLPPGK
ncbi:hypothetical protein PQG02_28000 [Nostoc sp. UHCC 0926]|uniref:hypothetical protein n=1 Tax=unclassified Nostoc TaxID=2593658 RepID=UPI0023621191|nr:hypothetical protein [Nostoc sp. UHCC 0926]WDD35918.1 hypothetical protein PQG02_28000 [Nostoc sp. UHCC 0926]